MLLSVRAEQSRADLDLDPRRIFNVALTPTRRSARGQVNRRSGRSWGRPVFDMGHAAKTRNIKLILCFRSKMNENSVLEVAISS